MSLSPDRWNAVSELFAELVELPPATREARLEQLDTDPEVRAEVRSLLEAAAVAGDRFEHGPLFEMPGGTNLAGQRIGAWQITREVGRGGMGTVYEAHRADDAFRKRVAIKVLAVHGDIMQSMRRFHRERQLLARLEHPNIATLLDEGITPPGEPFFIMEFVEGQPIDQWCASRKLGVAARLELFQQVGAAVQYAHERLVVHRDLKPANILVTTDGTVKLLDFGIAKVIDPSSDDAEPLTRTGALPMTAAYASPEQLRGDPVATASDVYSLGVVLYELLTGKRPFPATPWGVAPPDRDAPTLPSRAVSEAAASSMSEGTVARVRRALVGDVDSIVLMAMRPEEARRYRSVQQFTDDIERQLSGRPVVAQPDTLRYRLRKFVGRNRAAVVAAALTLTVMASATLISLHQASVARTERDHAILEQQRTQQVTQFFQDVLSTAKPQEGGRALTVVEAIDMVIPRIDRTFARQPDLRAAIKNTLGSTLTDMALFERAVPLVKDALRLRDSLDGNAPSRERADALYNLAGLEVEIGSSIRAESLYRASLDMYGRLPRVDSVEIYRGFNNLAGSVLSQGRLQDAIDLYGHIADRLAVMAPRDTIVQVVALTNYATALAQVGRAAEAEPRFRQALALAEAVRGPDDPRVATILQPLAGTLMFERRFAEAETTGRRAWEIDRKALGDDNPITLSALRMLINILGDGGKCADALPYSRSIVALRGHGLSEQDASLGTALLYLGWCEAVLGKPAEGEHSVREGLKLRVAAFPANHWAIANAESMLGDVLARLGPTRAAEAERLLRHGYDGMRRELDPQHMRVVDARNRLAGFLRAQGRTDEAVKLETASKTVTP